MKKIYLDWLLAAGWKKKYVQHGIAKHYILLPDRYLVTFAHFTDYSDDFTYHDEASLGTDWYARAWNYITKDNNKFVGFIDRPRRDKLVDPNGGSQEFMTACTEKIITWGESIDIPSEIERLASLRGPMAIGLLTYPHLISLALQRDTQQLNAYLEKMNDSGKDSLVIGSVIKRPVIEKALQLAQDETFPRPDFFK